MSKKEKFISVVDELFKKNDMKDLCGENYEDVLAYWEIFKGKDNKEKPVFTDNGKMILKHLQDNLDVEYWKAKDIAEGLFMSSRTVSGSIRKLVTDGFVEKVGQDPVIYMITDKGKEINIEN